MRIVFTLGISRPLSTMVVQSITSASPPLKATMALSSSPSAICPWATSSRRPGSIWRNLTRNLLDALNTWHHIEHLTATIELLTNGTAHRLVIQSCKVGFNRPPQAAAAS